VQQDACWSSAELDMLAASATADVDHHQESQQQSAYPHGTNAMSLMQCPIRRVALQLLLTLLLHVLLLLCSPPMTRARKCVTAHKVCKQWR
jgi:hypothetical protein